eukprot:m.1003494 g.1003494  ORF g.1003494 m.1003494 type:complete len:158 (+) comp24044_c0_seq9:271-744(+)
MNKPFIMSQRRISNDGEDDNDLDTDAPLLSEHRQEPLAAAIDNIFLRRGLRDVSLALKKGASINSPFINGNGTSKLALHCCIEMTLQASEPEQWKAGQKAIIELIKMGANPNKRDASNRTALEVIKSFSLTREDAENGREQVVRDVIVSLIKHGGAV